MKKALHWAGTALAVFGIIFLLGDGAAQIMDMGASVNFGDASEFEFVLVRFWQMGLGLLIPGGILWFATKQS
jgi:hypothetical protein